MTPASSPAGSPTRADEDTIRQGIRWILGGWIAGPSLYILLVTVSLSGHSAAPITYSHSPGNLLVVLTTSIGILYLTRPTLHINNYAPHRIGAQVLRATALLTTLTAALRFLGRLLEAPVFEGAVTLIWLPCLVTLTGLGYAFVGRLLRQRGKARLASLADYTGILSIVVLILIVAYPNVATQSMRLAMLGAIVCGSGVLWGLNQACQRSS